MTKNVINVRILGDNKGLKNSLSDSSSALGRWSSGLASVVKVGAAAAGVAAAGALTKGFMDALALQDNDALIGARLGVSPERAAELGDVASAAYRDAWGDNLSEVTDVVTGLETSFDGLGTSELERLTGQAIALGDAFAVDTSQGIQTASELVSSGLASSADEAFDLLTRGLQEMPQGIRDELFAAANEYGDFFADLGLSGDQAFAKLTQFADDGVYGIDKFGDALKELTIRGTDMSKASVNAYEAAGLSAEDMAARFLEGGDVARGALEDTAAGLLAIDDPVERANASIALFGTPLEDLSVSEIPDFLDGLTNVSAGMGDVEGAAGDVADTLGGTASTKIEAFKRQALGALADFAARELIPRFEQVVAWFQTHWPQIREIGQQVLDGYRAYWERVGRPVFEALVATAVAAVDWFRENWPAIRSVIESVFAWLVDEAWPVVQNVFAGLQTAAQAVADWFADNWPTIRSVIEGVFNWLVEVAWPAVQEVLGFVIDQFGVVVDWLVENWPKIQETIETVMSAVQTVIETVLGVIKGAWDLFGEQILAAVEVVWGTIQTIVETAINTVLSILEVVMGIITLDWETAWNGIKDFVSGIWDGIKGLIGAAIDAVKIKIAVVMAAISYAWNLAWEAVKTVVSTVWNTIRDTVSGAIDAVVGFIGGIVDRIAAVADGMFGPVISAAETLIGWMQSIIDKVQDTLDALARLNPTNYIGGLNSLDGTIDRVNEIRNGSSAAEFHSGGWVGNPNGAPRDVPAILQQGEFVLSRRMIADMGGGPGGGDMVGLQVNGDLRLDGVGAEQVARRINLAMAS